MQYSQNYRMKVCMREDRDIQRRMLSKSKNTATTSQPESSHCLQFSIKEFSANSHDRFPRNPNWRRLLVSKY